MDGRFSNIFLEYTNLCRVDLYFSIYCLYCWRTTDSLNHSISCLYPSWHHQTTRESLTSLLSSASTSSAPRNSKTYHTTDFPLVLTKCCRRASHSPHNGHISGFSLVRYTTCVSSLSCPLPPLKTSTFPILEVNIRLF